MAKNKQESLCPVALWQESFFVVVSKMSFDCRERTRRERNGARVNYAEYDIEEIVMYKFIIFLQEKYNNSI